MVRERALLPPKIIAINKAAALITKITFGRLCLMNFLLKQKAQPEILVRSLDAYKLK